MYYIALLAERASDDGMNTEHVRIGFVSAIKANDVFTTSNENEAMTFQSFVDAVTFSDYIRSLLLEHNAKYTDTCVCELKKSVVYLGRDHLKIVDDVLDYEHKSLDFEFDYQRSTCEEN